jgi:nitroreductase
MRGEMMNLSEAIKNRRSIRKFTNDPVPADLIKEILNAGMAAPSSGNLQCRHFYVVTNADLKKKIAAAALDQKFIAESPVVFVICADHKIRAEYGDRGVSTYVLLDCAAAVQNMLLTAHSLKLGTCWVGAFYEDRVAKILDIPDNYRPMAIVPCGYPAESPETPPRVRFDDACTFL